MRLLPRRSLKSVFARAASPSGVLIATALIAVGALGVRRSIRRRLKWNGQRVLIMGGTRGLGFVLGRELLRRQSSIVITARSDEELANARGALLKQNGQALPPERVLTIRCDVADAIDVKRAIGLAREHLGGIDVLVNNAGIIQVGPLESMRFEDFQAALGVHFQGPLMASLEVLEEMRHRGSGRIVNISSIGGLVSIPHLLPYVASKFALTGLSQGLHAELSKSGVRVTTICPGLMRTGSSYRALFKSQHRKEHTWFALGVATPLTSMSAPRAARQIIRAVERGKPFVVLSWQAKLLAKLHALAPNTSLRALSAVNRLLPSFGGIGTEAAEGRDSESRLVPSLITRQNDRAARDFAELSPESQAGV